MLCEKYTILDLEQGSSAWHEARKEKIGASEAPTIVGANPNETPRQLWDRRLGFISPKKQTKSMQRGKLIEPVARKKACEILKCDLITPTVVPVENDWMICSFDGMDIDKRIVCEIKSSHGENHEMAMDGVIPDRYKPQLIHQLYVAKLIFEVDVVYYFSYGKTSFKMLEFTENHDEITKQIHKEKKFWDHLQDPVGLGPPEMTEIELINWG